MENLIVLLVKRLDTWTAGITMNGQACTWCVGGSLVETINIRDAAGNATMLRFVACARDNWVRAASVPPS